MYFFVHITLIIINDHQYNLSNSADFKTCFQRFTITYLLRNFFVLKKLNLIKRILATSIVFFSKDFHFLLLSNPKQWVVSLKSPMLRYIQLDIYQLFTRLVAQKKPHTYELQLSRYVQYILEGMDHHHFAINPYV